MHSKNNIVFAQQTPTYRAIKQIKQNKHNHTNQSQTRGEPHSHNTTNHRIRTFKKIRQKILIFSALVGVLRVRQFEQKLDKQSSLVFGSALIRFRVYSKFLVLLRGRKLLNNYH